ncbi:monovalent cation/H(+) antiporter subunit G [Aciduricibacillus chroicocephali]|uniref:Monovalent cation/H(+) antiporter subunit G n=1 Tax=Aciduricibacillus chroicocephali TaxID=3054939 RepID=A0ABY9KSE0_9BACI|nr:monovalent cation/H(+) antiporter subunit G [Bacillaceae bacterium 44XB]
MTETLIDIISNIATIVLLLSGTFFIISSSIGVLRFPDVFTRLHAATKASTLGIASVLVGTFIYLYAEYHVVSGKLILAILFIFLTNPVSGHMLSRAAHGRGIKPIIHNRKDAYEDAIKKSE